MSFVERVDLHMRCIVFLGAGQMDDAERKVTIRALTNKCPLTDAERELARQWWKKAGCRLEAQFEPLR